MSFFHRILREHWLWYIGLLTLAIGLPLSRSLVSIAPGIIAGAWLFDGLYQKDIGAKWKRFIGNKNALALAGIFFIYLFWSLLSDNSTMALKIVVDKLPLLIFPIAFTSIPNSVAKNYQFFLLFHIAAVLLSSIVSYVYFLSNSNITDMREAVQMINHVRLSLMVVLGMVSMYFLAKSKNGIWSVIAVVISLWFAYFLVKFRMATGLGLLWILTLVYAIGLSKKNKKNALFGALLLIMFISSGVYVIQIASAQFSKPSVHLDALPKSTKNGSTYYHQIENKLTQNGHYVWHYLAEKELIEAWNRRSAKQIILEKDSGILVEGALIRYLTSLNLPKDSEGVLKLSTDDIKRIESGIASAHDYKANGFEKRIAALCYELDDYWQGGDPSLNSLTVKFEYWKVAIEIIKKNLWLGVGTGDVKDAFMQEYEQGTRLKKSAWDKTHNQFLTWLVTFGFLIGALVAYLFFRPMFHRASGKLIFPVAMVYLVFALSAIMEDTFETQLGIGLFLFYFGISSMANLQETKSE